MLLLPGPDFQSFSTNWSGAPAANIGTTVTTGASNADGSAVTLLSALGFDAYLIELWFQNNNTTATDTSTLIHIGYDPTGGTTWNDLILSLPAGFCYSNNLVGNSYGGRRFAFPLYIPAGSTILARGRNVTGSTRTVSVGATVHGRPKNPSQLKVGTAVDVFGDVRASSGGTAIPPNASLNTFGSWTNVGSATVLDYFFIHLGTQGPASNNWTSGRAQAVEFGIDGTNALSQPFYYSLSGNEIASDIYPLPAFYRSIPAGSQMKLRTKDSAASGQSPMFTIHAVR